MSSHSDPRKFIEELISSNKVVVFSKSYCPYCTKAKRALESLGARYEAIELDTRSDGSAIQQALAELTGRRTVPNVFVGGKTIGGGDETESLRRSGRLTTMLQEVSAL